VVADALARIAAQPEFNAVITVCEQNALARARAGVSGALAGVPVLIKDLIDTPGVRTTYASSIYADHVPQESAPAVLALEAEGAIVVARRRRRVRLGRVRPEHFYGDTVNPTAPDRVAGGSSSGNAAAVAADMVPLGLGTDTGGSVRAAGRVLRDRRAQDGPRCRVDPGRLSAGGELRHRRPAGGDGGRLRAGLRRAQPRPRCRHPRWRACASACLRPTPRSGPPTPSCPAARDERALAERRPAAGARRDVRELVLPVPAGDTWAVFYAETAAAHTATFPQPGEEYGPLIRAKLDHAITVTAAQEQGGAKRSTRGAPWPP
jgi:hypothetical protein